MAAGRVRVCLLAAALIAGALGPWATAASSSGVPCNKPGRLTVQPHFLTVSLPNFPDSDYPYDPVIPTQHVVVSADYGLSDAFRAVVANSSSVSLTTNGGCDWAQVHTQPATVDSEGNTGPAAANLNKVGSVAVSKQARTSQVFVEVEGPNAQGNNARVLVSHDNGRTWASHPFASDDGGHLVTPPLEPRVVYLAGSRSRTQTTSDLWRSDDAGDHWRQVAMPAGLQWRGAHYANGLVADPVQPRRLWAYDSADATGAVYRSDDAGGSWRKVGQVGRTIYMFSVWYRNHRPIVASAPTLAQATTNDTTGPKSLPYWDADVSTDGGSHWARLKIPVQRQSESVASEILIALVQPAAASGLVGAVVEYSADGRTGIVRALTSLNGIRWSSTAQLARYNLAVTNCESGAVNPGSVGAWWQESPNGSGNYLLRYSRER